jgi:nitrite reductase (NADH) small subunit
MTALDERRVAVWTAVCRYDELLCERGVAALLPGGRQVALFRLADGTVHAVGQRDPYSGANVMSRGLVGTRGDRHVVASPMYKQHFDLRSGEAVDDPDVRLPVHLVRVRDGLVEVSTAEVGSWA